MRKLLKFEITETEFDNYVSGGNLALLSQTDDTMLYGTALGADIKYENYKNENGDDAFRILQFAPQEITCGKCHIKIHTEYYDECPVCGKTLDTLVAANRKFNDTMHDFNAKLNEEFQTRHREFNEKLIKECGFDF